MSFKIMLRTIKCDQRGVALTTNIVEASSKEECDEIMGVCNNNEQYDGCIMTAIVINPTTGVDHA